MKNTAKPEAELALVERDGARTSARERLVSLLLGVAEYVRGAPVRRLVPNIVSTDPDLAHEIARAGALQKLGYDVEFAYLPRFYDSPRLYVCMGHSGERKYLASGFDFYSKSDAFLKTMSELLERITWFNDDTYWSAGSLRKPMREMRDAIALSPLAGFSDAQRKDIPGLSFRPASEFLWTPATKLSNGRATWVPAQLVSARYATHDGKTEAVLRTSNSNGLATHATFEDAALSGLLELIERDAFMITYHNKISAPKIDPRTIRSARTRELLDMFERFELTCDFLVLPSDIPAHSIACVIKDASGEGPAFALGAKAHFDPEIALLGALTESYAVWHLARVLGLYQQELPPEPWDTVQRLAFWAKPENARTLDWMTDGALIALPDAFPESSARELAGLLAQDGIDAAAVRMSGDALEKLGFHTVCVVSPELQPLSLEGNVPYLGGKRLQSVPVKLGYESRTMPPTILHPFP